MEDYRDATKDYRDENAEARDHGEGSRGSKSREKAGISDEELGLSRPKTKPKKTEFKLSVETITKSNLDPEDFEIEEVQFQNATDGWEHDINGPLIG